MESKQEGNEYEDLLPVMAEKLDVDAFVEELCGGFRVLADPTGGLITPASLQKNSAFFECKKLFVVHLSERENFVVPKNLKLLAVPLFELYDNVVKRAPIVALSNMLF
ncbi:Ca2+-binding protein (Centrin/caltractin) [Abeliophyllum distichum]|uniref:Ca2+-binding protein (Centrin/caltractin) n=1 Tax=Abeliophyllum distichum TaxID=126358 RepID=A0ABD1PFW5_9LAMI